MEESNTNQSPKWPGRLTILFALLFALFWSLGSFFFWILLGLTIYFGFLAVYLSAGVKQRISDFASSFTRSQRPPKNPYQAFRPRTEVQADPTTTTLKVAKLIRGLFFLFLGLFLTFFIIGIFSGTDEDTRDGANIDVNQNDTPDVEVTTDWNERGNAALQDNNFDSAFYYYDKALAIDPENMYSLYNKGLAYSLRQDYRRSNGLARRCIQYHPDYFPAWWLLGYNYDLIANTDSAVYCLEKAYSDGYRQPDFVQLIAEVYTKKSRLKDALQAYQQLVEMDTTRADIFRKMAELDPSMAERYLGKAHALDGN